MPASTPYEQELRDRLARAERQRDQLGRMCAAYEDKFKMQREVVCAARDWRKADADPHVVYMDRCRPLLDVLADAVDALNEWAKERAKEREHGTDDER
jgi:hypothetical protein